MRTFRDPVVEALFRREPCLPPEIRRSALRKLALVDCAIRLSDLERLPANHLRTLEGGSHKGLHQVAIADGWMLRFRWMDGDAYQVAIGSDTPSGCAPGPRLSPVHPGEVLHEELMRPYALSAAGLARALAIPSSRLRALLAGRSTLDAELALRLGRRFGLMPAFWLNLQQRYDLSMASDAVSERVAQEVRPFVSGLEG